ncbi:MAG: hypothetical protein CVV44_19850 [Spirochaetae bacterium HGW-Spirochaetae-1]|jgi:two-component sensor histidine kinase/ActR/RegA family two-component response regulator|nr:MAG: hypothetical protein CVV44_19850 [Spirochaetae bacterium HGW-Spirochaetae-1]
MKNIVIIEHEVQFSREIIPLLPGDSYVVTGIVRNPRDWHSCIEEANPHVIIADGSLPYDSLWLQAISSFVDGKNPPIIFINDTVTDQPHAGRPDLGMSGILLRPLSAERLNTEINISLSRKAFCDRMIDERSENENRMEESLKEKELLLREIHHRVKNNMQIISSLLDLQYHRIINITDRQLFLDSQNRVRAMALVHEKLYQSDSMTNIDFENYIQGLIREYNDTLSSMTKNVVIDIRVKDVYMDINDAIPCALIVNELLTNSLKHAFPGGRRGTISVDFYVDEEGLYSLTVADDGVGIPREFDIKNNDSLGMQLIHALTHQLKGSISCDSGSGTKFMLSFGKGGKAGPSAANLSGRDAGEVRNIKILIVEDERITGMNMKAMLIRAGYGVSRVISRGADVLPAVILEKPDLVLMDIFLEDDMDGIAVAGEMKKQFDIPVIFITANADQEVKQRALATNPVAYLHKPIDKVELVGAVYNVMRKDAD